MEFLFKKHMPVKFDNAINISKVNCESIIDLTLISNCKYESNNVLLGLKCSQYQILPYKLVTKRKTVGHYNQFTPTELDFDCILGNIGLFYVGDHLRIPSTYGTFVL